MTACDYCILLFFLVFPLSIDLPYQFFGWRWLYCHALLDMYAISSYAIGASQQWSEKMKEYEVKARLGQLQQLAPLRVWRAMPMFAVDRCYAALVTAQAIERQHAALEGRHYSQAAALAAAADQINLILS